MRRLSSLVVSVLVVAGFAAAAGPAASAGPSSSVYQRLMHQSRVEFLRTHGYLPAGSVAHFYRAKEAAAADVHPSGYDNFGDPTQAAPSAPTIGKSWNGLANSSLAPLDPNGAKGPGSYVEIINDNIGIYHATGLVSGTLAALTGEGSSVSLSDPMVLWDPNTQRFYFSLIRWSGTTFTSPAIDWGFSKSSDPANVTTDWCHYTSAAWPNGSIPDYPKLGQTADFLLVGVNYYPNATSNSTDSQLAWFAKPQGTGTITTCPAAPAGGLVTGLKNSDGTQAFTPVPAIQTDPSSTGYVVAGTDMENTSSGNQLTVFTVTDNGGVPQVSAPDTITVPTYSDPPDAPQKGTSYTLDTLDGRFDHAVSGVDPRVGATTVWVAHTVAGGAGSQVRWYEVNPAAGSLAQSGTVTSSSLYVFNAGISNDRTCTATQCAHGDSMVLGVTASSASMYPLDGMVSKVGAGAQSAGVLVHASTTYDHGFDCLSLGYCRWGDYGGATPDPAASLSAAHGLVWLTNMLTNGGSLLKGGDTSWNWSAAP